MGDGYRKTICLLVGSFDKVAVSARLLHFNCVDDDVGS